MLKPLGKVEDYASSVIVNCPECMNENSQLSNNLRRRRCRCVRRLDCTFAVGSSLMFVVPGVVMVTSIIFRREV